MDIEQDVLAQSDPVNIFQLSSSPTDDNIRVPTRPAILRSRRVNPAMPILSTSPTIPIDITSQTNNSIVHNNTLTPNDSSPSSCSVSPANSIPIPCKQLIIKDRKLKDLPTDHPSLTLQTPEAATPPSHIDISDFECPLCFQVYLQPVTTPCGHVFCKQCLFRAIKHSSSCPLCRHKMDPSAPQKYSVNIVLMNVIEKYFPIEHRERVSEEEEQKTEEPLKPEADESLRPSSPSNWSSILPSLRSTCTVLLSCGGF